MKIGIDIDGVLTDIERWQLDYGSKYYYLTLNKSIINYKGYETIDVFGVTKEEDNIFWNKYFKEYSKNVACRKFADEIISQLKQDGYEIYIITARCNGLDRPNSAMSIAECKKIVLDWLKSNHIIYDKIIFSNENKLDECIKNKIDIMIEDSPTNINMISSKIPVICFNANYNEKCTGNNIIRCYSWYNIYDEIRKMTKN